MYVSFKDGKKRNEDNVDCLRYSVTEPFKALNVSLAYGQKYQIYGKDCYGCDTDSRMESVYIDN